MHLAINLGNCLEHKTMRNSPPVHGYSLCLEETKKITKRKERNMENDGITSQKLRNEKIKSRFNPKTKS